jgi:hypothetical protein
LCFSVPIDDLKANNCAQHRCPKDVSVLLTSVYEKGAIWLATHITLPIFNSAFSAIPDAMRHAQDLDHDAMSSWPSTVGSHVYRLVRKLTESLED